MSKREFLDLLRYYLRDYPSSIVNDIVADYEAHFFEGLQNNKTEEEISKELGSPKDIANEFLSNNEYRNHGYIGNQSNFTGNSNVQNPKGANNSKLKRLSVLEIILLIIGGIMVAPIAFSLVVSVLSICLSILASLVAIAASFFVMGISLIFSHFVEIPYFVGFFGYTPNILTSILIGIFMMSAAVLIVALSIKLAMIFVKQIKNLYLAIKWRIQKRRNG